MSRFQQTTRALRHRNFRLFFIGQTISMVGTWMQQVAMAWLVYRLTGSAALLGTMGFVSQLPIFLLSALGGAMADRKDRRKILLVTQSTAMLLALVLAILTLTGNIQVWHLFTLGIGLGVCSAFDIPARQSFITQLVDKEEISNAIALNASIFHGSRILGPAVAGVLVSLVGEGWCFGVNALSFVAVLIGLAMMQLTPAALTPTKSAWLSIVDGFRYVWAHPQIRSIMQLVATVSLFGMSYMVLMPVISDRILHGGVRGMGILMGMSGIGAFASALVLAAKTSHEGIATRIGFSSIGFGASLALFAFSHTFWLSAVLLIPTGFFMVAQMASSNTLLQSLVTDEYRGRSMAVYGIMLMGMAPFGALLAGHAATWLGTMQTVCIGGSITVLAGIFFLYQNRQH